MSLDSDLIRSLKKAGEYYVSELKSEILKDGNKASGRLIKSINSDVSNIAGSGGVLWLRN